MGRICTGKGSWRKCRRKISSRLLHLRLGRHVDKIDDDRAAEIAQPALPGDLLGGGQIGIDGRPPASIDIDGDTGRSLFDQDSSATRKRHLARRSNSEFVGHAGKFEQALVGVDGFDLECTGYALRYTAQTGGNPGVARRNPADGPIERLPQGGIDRIEESRQSGARPGCLFEIRCKSRKFFGLACKFGLNCPLGEAARGQPAFGAYRLQELQQGIARTPLDPGADGMAIVIGSEDQQPPFDPRPTGHSRSFVTLGLACPLNQELLADSDETFDRALFFALLDRAAAALQIATLYES